MDIEAFREECRKEQKVFVKLTNAWNRVQQKQWNLGRKYRPIRRGACTILCPNCNTAAQIYRIQETEYFIFEHDCGWIFAEMIRENDPLLSAGEYNTIGTDLPTNFSEVVERERTHGMALTPRHIIAEMDDGPEAMDDGPGPF